MNEEYIKTVTEAINKFCDGLDNIGDVRVGTIMLSLRMTSALFQRTLNADTNKGKQDLNKYVDYMIKSFNEAYPKQINHE